MIEINESKKPLFCLIYFVCGQLYPDINYLNATTINFSSKGITLVLPRLKLSNYLSTYIRGGGA